MTEYVYLGAAQATYAQYLAVSPAGDTTLTAAPGETYDIRPAPGYENSQGVSALPVPPGDGLWAEASKAASPSLADNAETAPAPTRKGA